jgi:serine/threonine-protein kinase
MSQLPEKNNSLAANKTEYLGAGKQAVSGEATQPVGETTLEQPPAAAQLTAGLAVSSDLTVNLVTGGISLSPEEMREFLPPETECRKWGKYEILREIGRGGMGRVVLWKDNNIQRIVATKLQLPNTGKNQETTQRFFEEGQITGQLEHPNIVPIHEMGSDGEGNLYFTMKYVKGKSLQKLIDEIKQNRALRQEWSPSKMLQVFQSVCYAIEYAHAKNVIHRDLKPDNIMLGNFGEVMVMDWGLAKVVGQGREILSDDAIKTLRLEGGFKTIAGKIAGTPLYMSPEQANGDLEHVDQRSDIYSLGVMLYEMLCGQHTLNAAAGALVVLRDLVQGNSKPLPAHGLFGPIPRELQAIVQKAMQYKREDRYATVREMAEEIQRFLDGREVRACVYSLFDKTWRQVRRYRREIAIAAATLFVLLPCFLLWGYRQNSDLAQQHIVEGLKLVECKSVSDAFIKIGAAEQELDPYLAKHKKEEAKKYFEHVKTRVFDAVEYYQQAYNIRAKDEYRKTQADAWLKLFEAAMVTEDMAWLKTARQKIKAVVDDKTYRAEYANKIEYYREVSITTEPMQVKFYLYKYEEMRSQWQRLVALPYDSVHDTIKGERSVIDDPDAKIAMPWDVQEQDTAFFAETAPTAATLQITLPTGSYLFICKKAGHLPVRVPVTVKHRLLQTRQASALSFHISLPRQGQIPDDFVYLPKTSFLAGGDAVGALNTHPSEAGPVYMQKREVTFGQYKTFLDELFANLGEADGTAVLHKILALKRRSQNGLKLQEATNLVKTLMPLQLFRDSKIKDIKAEQYTPDKQFPLPLLGSERLSFEALMPRTFEGPLMRYAKHQKTVQISPKLREYMPQWEKYPVYGITKLGADLYAAWRAQKENRRYRLPSEQEWELAARGSDGRIYPWGNVYWLKAAQLNAGYGLHEDKDKDEEKGEQPKEVSHATADVSVWGIHDLPGSLGEWTSSVFNPGDAKKTYTIKGNIWGLTPEGIKNCFRVGETELYFHPTLGFRLALDAE